MARRLSLRGRTLRSPERFEAFYRAESEALLTFLTRRVLDPEIALDLTAESFARALHAAPRLRARSDGETLAWLYAIARNVLADYYREGHADRKRLAAMRVEVPVLDDREIERIEELAGLADQRELVRSALGGLADGERAAVELRVVEELPYAELAARLAISEQAARARVSRGLRRLEAALEAEPTKKGSVR